MTFEPAGMIGEQFQFPSSAPIFRETGGYAQSASHPRPAMRRSTRQIRSP